MSDWVASDEILNELETRFTEVAPYILDYNYTVAEEQKQAVAASIREFYLQGEAISKHTISNIVQVSCIQNGTQHQSTGSSGQILSGSLVMSEVSHDIPQFPHVKSVTVIDSSPNPSSSGNVIILLHFNKTKTKNLWPLVGEQTVLTERPPPVGEISAIFCGQRVLHGQHNRSLQPYSRFFRPEPLIFLPSSSSVVLTRLSGPRSIPTASQKMW
jgi:hypothetical protein